MDIFATIYSAGVPQNGLTDDPEVEITDDAGTIVQAFTAMTDLGNSGKHVFAFVIPDTARNYTFQVDADPNVSGQVAGNDRFYNGAFSGEADIIATSVDVTGIETNILGAIAALNNLSIADVQTALTNQGYTSARAAFLDIINTNLDVAVSSRNAVTPLAAATDQAEHDATQAAIAALNNVSIADVQTALTNQGYTAARALLLDNMDVAVSTRNSVTPLAAATDQAEHDATQAGIAANLAAIAALNNISVSDILTAVLTSGNTVDAELSGILALRAFVEGGRDIDFVGNDALGWQRIERDVGGTLIRRYNLFDEGGARITGTVAAFISSQKMIASEVAI